MEVTREGRFTLYRARGAREEDYRRMETNGLLRRYYKNSVAGMVAALVQDEALTGSELAELKELLRKAGEPVLNDLFYAVLGMRPGHARSSRRCWYCGILRVPRCPHGSSGWPG